MTRIIAGAARGRRLKTPTGTATRPTSDRVREALFSALESELGTLSGTRFLDLFAGSGAVGLEARSRGAADVVLVEYDKATAALIRSNAEQLGLGGVTVLTSRAERLPESQPHGAFDVVYVDPPYSMEKAAVFDTIGSLRTAGWFSHGALVVVERPRRDGRWMWPVGLEGVREKKYGETMLWYGRSTHGAPGPDDAV
jgi:16S rRNA (guanine966-N2)-methyltransferase